MEAFDSYSAFIPPPLSTLNMRVVSSHPAHERHSSISPADEVVILTTQTAISAMVPEALDLRGDRSVSTIEKFVRASADHGLFVVLDEAHHAPAFGCRTLLQKLKQLTGDMQLLGLTATPTYTDESRRGWLYKIFGEKPVYRARQGELIAQNILAKPKFEEMATGFDLEVDNTLRQRLQQEHKDLPADIVKRIADNSARNDFIVRHYVGNRARYGKTLIFADHWDQCVYIERRLRAQNVKAAAVFSHVDAAEPGVRSTMTIENANNIRAFKDNELEVLVNVRMLTEGTDVPDTRTVFVTRQTTSSILLTQMIGRALRGKRAGGGKAKHEANIVLFVDNWKGLLVDVWARPDNRGDTVEDARIVRGYLPLQYVSIRLIEALANSFPATEGDEVQPFLCHVPVGWYFAEFSEATVDDEGKEAMELVREFVMVYERAKPEYDRFLKEVFPKLSPEWGREKLAQDWLDAQVAVWRERFFRGEEIELGGDLGRNLASLARHMGATGSLPIFYPLDDRDKHDMDALAQEMSELAIDQQRDRLHKLFHTSGSLWPVFYKNNFPRFLEAFQASLRRLVLGPVASVPSPRGRAKVSAPAIEIPPELRKKIFARDDHTCQACGAQGKGVKLNADHMRSENQGGLSIEQNLQTLCSVCNGKYKRKNSIDFLRQATPLAGPKPPQFESRNGDEDPKRAFRRLVNFWYHCGAVCEVRISERRNGRNYAIWEVDLHSGNSSEWLQTCKEDLLRHIAEDFRCKHVTDIVIG
ncbi:MAG: HNH endonuclease [Planctomycetes bacterium]|nr:HNH endonuclease [Planctomycetota bacterium]